jgi:hypothetical protein
MRVSTTHDLGPSFVDVENARQPKVHPATTSNGQAFVPRMSCGAFGSPRIRLPDCAEADPTPTTVVAETAAATTPPARATVSSNSR